MQLVVTMRCLHFSDFPDDDVKKVDLVLVDIFERTNASIGLILYAQKKEERRQVCHETQRFLFVY